MHERYRPGRGEPVEPRPDPPRPRGDADAVLAMQRAIGNHGTAQLLARDAKGKNRPNFEHSVKLGKLGTIEIKGGNIAEWAAKKDPDGLKIVSPSGKHSKELKRLFESKARIDTVETSSVVGENTLVSIVFKDCQITRYAGDEQQDEWTVEFAGAKRQSLSIGAAR